MKLFFISDIHGSLSNLQTALEFFKKEQADKLVILGDVMYHGPRNPLPEEYKPADVAALLNQYKSKIVAVRGNCDSEVDQMLLEYPMMETNAVIQFEERAIFLSHGHIYNPDELPPLNTGDIFAFGHVHLPIAEKQDDIYIFNPGSIALPKQENPRSYGTFDGKELVVKSFTGETLCKTEVI